jgi:cell division protein FtsB
LAEVENLETEHKKIVEDLHEKNDALIHSLEKSWDENIKVEEEATRLHEEKKEAEAEIEKLEAQLRATEEAYRSAYNLLKETGLAYNLTLEDIKKSNLDSEN